MCKCEYPECSLESKTTWGLVPLCSTHFKLILEETLNHYKNSRKINYSQRYHYLKISEKIPWSRAE